MLSTQDVKNEILQHPPKQRCCQNTFLKTCFEGNVLSFRGVSMARFFITLLKNLKISDWGMGISKHGVGHSGRIILGENEVLESSKKVCCQRSLLQALFLRKGSLSVSTKGYHLEISGMSKSNATSIARLCSGSRYQRRGRWVVYVKNGDSIGRFLNWIGAHQSLLRFEEIRAVKETKNEVRRRVNYESANLSRVAKAVSQQKKKLQQVLEWKDAKKLTSSLRQAAEARLHFPRLSLNELAIKLRISKSALNHRLRRLLQM